MRIKCDQCVAVMINHVFCHERGCPNLRKRWIDGEWVTILECHECGGEVREGGQCECMSAIEEEAK